MAERLTQPEGRETQSLVVSPRQPWGQGGGRRECISLPTTHTHTPPGIVINLPCGQADSAPEPLRQPLQTRQGRSPISVPSGVPGCAALENSGCAEQAGLMTPKDPRPGPLAVS